MDVEWRDRRTTTGNPVRSQTVTSTTTSNAPGPLVPRRWQEEALTAWDVSRRGVVSVVTGAGKTAFALFAYQRAAETVPDLRLVVVVPTLALLDQWAVVLEMEAGFAKEEVALYSGESRSSRPGRANVIVINTARTSTDLFRDEVPTMLVVDECHRAGSPENARALGIPATMTLGLSATPVREFDDGFSRYVEPALGPIIYEYDYSAARADGVISPFDLHNFHFELSPQETERYDALSQRVARRLAVNDGDMEDPVVKQILLQRAGVSVSSPRRTAAAAAVVDRFPKPMLIFHERVASAEAIAHLLDKTGHRVATYHSKLGSSLRRRNLELFKLGEIDVLVTCRALDEGLNVPAANAAVVAASTRSTRQRIQRLGRVLRQSPGKRFASVATLYATDAERNFLEHEAARLADVTAVKWYEVSI
jgi:superfamily II DNA or RNA helicase